MNVNTNTQRQIEIMRGVLPLMDKPFNQWPSAAKLWRERRNVWGAWPMVVQRAFEQMCEEIGVELR